MIIHTEHLGDFNYEAIYSYLQSITVQSYQPFHCGYTHSYELRNYPDFRLMEGVIVPPHSDKIAAYRPILMLHNPGNSYIVRGHSQTLPQLVLPQRKGTMIVLDIDAQHEVHSQDPNGGFGAWAGLVWGPGGGPLMKTEWKPGNVAEKVREEFSWFCNSIIKEKC